MRKTHPEYRLHVRSRAGCGEGSSPAGLAQCHPRNPLKRHQQPAGKGLVRIPTNNEDSTLEFIKRELTKRTPRRGRRVLCRLRGSTSTTRTLRTAQIYTFGEAQPARQESENCWCAKLNGPHGTTDSHARRPSSPSPQCSPFPRARVAPLT